MWYRLIDIQSKAESGIRAVIQVPGDSPWFDGHFPGEPVLPGVAQISMVFDVIQKASECERGVSRINRVRFKRIVRPDDLLTVVAVPLEKEADAYSFLIKILGDLVCSGVMRLKSKPHSS